jgi:hypothetical protein
MTLEVKENWKWELARIEEQMREAEDTMRSAKWRIERLQNERAKLLRQVRA